MTLLDFSQVFEVETDASATCIGVVLTHEGILIEYFNEKLSKTRQKWITYEQEFVLHSDPQPLNFINSQWLLSRIHARWVLFLQKFSFVFKHCLDI